MEAEGPQIQERKVSYIGLQENSMQGCAGVCDGAAQETAEQGSRLSSC